MIVCKGKTKKYVPGTVVKFYYNSFFLFSIFFLHEECSSSLFIYSGRISCDDLLLSLLMMDLAQLGVSLIPSSSFSLSPDTN
jgi:hypothetical protein